MRLELKYKEKTTKKHKHVEAKQYATMNHWKIKEGIKIMWRQMEMEAQWSKISGMQQNQF